MRALNRWFAGLKAEVWPGQDAVVERSGGPYRYEMRGSIDEGHSLARVVVVVYRGDTVVTRQQSSVHFRPR